SSFLHSVHQIRITLTSTILPYTTLFRSRGSQRQGSTVDYSGVEVTSQVVGAKPVAGTGGLQRLGSVTGVGIARGEDPRGKRGNYYEQQKCASQSQAEFGYPTAASAFEFWSAGVICW